jgi:hypothetical protein
VTPSFLRAHPRSWPTCSSTGGKPACRVSGSVPGPCPTTSKRSLEAWSRSYRPEECSGGFAVRRQLPCQPWLCPRGRRRLRWGLSSVRRARPALYQPLRRRSSGAVTKGGSRVGQRLRPWVRSIRSGEGAIEFPTPEQASTHVWSPEDRALVEDRVETQFVGTPGQVADQLEQLRDATGADELIVTTITHRHADRVRSYELLAEEWRER